MSIAVYIDENNQILYFANCDLERRVRALPVAKLTTRIPRTYVSRSTAPHFNRPMHIRPSLAAFNEPARPKERTEARASIATRCSSLTRRPKGRLRAALFRD